MAFGTLYLIPSTLGDYDPALVLPAPVLERLKSIKRFIVEETRTARRFLSAAGLKGHIGELELRELNEHTKPSEIEGFMNMFSDASGNPADVGLITEAGKVVPMVGPSSLMLALMASGLNGQSFAFVGYLPAKTEERRRAIAEVEKRSLQLHQTQIFIETPYRNDSLMADLLQSLSPATMLTVAASITADNEYIDTKPVREWRKMPATIGKRPCVFLLLANK